MKDKCYRIGCTNDADHIGERGMSRYDLCDQHHNESMEYQKTHFAYMNFHGELQNTDPEIHKLFWRGSHQAEPGKVTIEIESNNVVQLYQTRDIWFPKLMSYLPENTQVIFFISIE